MKILYITGQIAFHGGIERITCMKVNYLAEHTQHESYLSTYKQQNAPFVYSLSTKVHYSDLGIDYDVNYSSRPLYTFRQIKRVPKHILLTYRLINNIKPDVIIIPNFDYEFWFLPYIKGRAKIIREFHSTLCNSLSYPHYSKYWFKTKFDTWVAKKYDRVVLSTANEVNFLPDLKNKTVIPNPIEISSQKSDLRNAQVISIGRIHPVKQFEKFIKIAHLVISVFPECNFSIYGGGDPLYMADLNHLINHLGLEGKVSLCGPTTDVQRVLSKSSIYVCTSREECFGVTLIEALESGVPVVSFDCPFGPRNIIHNKEDGFLVKQDSIEECSEAILRLLKNEQMRNKMGAAALISAQAYHIENIMSKWLELFMNLMGNE